MIHIKELINNFDIILTKLNRRGQDYTNLLSDIVEHYNNYQKNLQILMDLNTKKNKISDLIKKRNFKDNDHFQELINKTKQLNIKQKEIQVITDKEKEKYLNLLLLLPNVPHGTIPDGLTEKENKIISMHNEKPNFLFTPLSHIDIIDKNSWLSESVKNLSGSRFVYYNSFLSKLRRSLINFFIESNIMNGYHETHPPVLVKYDSLQGTGQFPKFIEDMYKTDQNLYLSPTSEIQLMNKYNNIIINENELPIQLTAFTNCFRKEAGSAGKDTRGLIRLHEFGKVEIVKILRTDDPVNELNKIVKNVCFILDKLELHYRIIELCAGDLGFSSRKTYDIEVWLPSSGIYREISSCSWCNTFQSIRMNLKYKDSNNNKYFPDTFNASSLPIERTIAAIIENYQKEDATINIPKCLKKYF